MTFFAKPRIDVEISEIVTAVSSARGALSVEAGLRKPWFSLCILAMGLLGIEGCQKSDRLSIAGNVSLDGRPLEAGIIDFLPSQKTNSPTAGCEIKGGAFSIGSERGVMPGTFRVEISALRPSGGHYIDSITKRPVEKLEETVPARYNTNSRLQVTIEAGTNNHFDFPLESN